MKRNRSFIILLTIGALVMTSCLVGCGTEELQETTAPTEPGVRTVVDMAGREVTVPHQIDKVFSTNPPGTILLYTMDPELLIGWNYELGEAEKRFILPQYHELPNLGGWMAKSTCNTEELLKIKPDLIIFMTDISKMTISQADDIQKQVEIPVVMVNGDLTKMDETYEFTGKLLNMEKQAEILGTYCRETVNQVQNKSQNIAEDKRVRVYYAEGADGLQTDPSGSRHTEVLDMVGGVNVADVIAKGQRGLTQVSHEQVLLWNPDAIICWGQCFEKILSDPKWQNIKAVQDKKVYIVPSGPFNWFDRPPSVNRILGLKWLGNLLYPEVYGYDIANETREFYQKFYHYDLTEEDINFLLKDSGGI